ncbi:MgtC/SapB family protein [Falsigemmobacter faecalis]|uniref:Protein MgtC n=2 Tax=Falsigemmobacter faecalis TaxID=2488730 RepID=A0A3P3DXX1_9RHOB|nr:MgtC/SapB family protein [Falsigemmobacter faecalis]
MIGSLVAGLLIGAEREFSGKPAGLRTHTLVCFASALMTLAGVRMAEWTVALPADTQIVSDMARMPHAILTGIGFLGAGVIFREGVNVHGLTTAASLWFTSALGIIWGTGLTELAVIGTVAALLVLAFLRAIQPRKVELQSWQLALSYSLNTAPTTADLTERLRAAGWTSGPAGVEETSEQRRYTLTLSPAAPGAPDPAALIGALRAATHPEHLSLQPVLADPV